MPSINFKLRTHYGPVTFTGTFSDSGRLLEVQSSTDKLSPMMQKLTFGDQAEAANKYLQALKSNVFFQLEALPFLPNPPAHFALKGKVFSSISKQGQVNAAIDRESADRIQFWRKYQALNPLLFLDTNRLDASLQRMLSSAKRWQQEPTKALQSLEPWAFTLLDLAQSGSINLVWQILGKIGTPSIANRMIRELEREGVHPDAKGIFAGLLDCFEPKRDADRLLTLGARRTFQGAYAERYVKILTRIKDPRSVELAKSILPKRVSVLPDALAVFRLNEIEDPVGLVLEEFWQLDESYKVFRCIELLWDHAPTDRHVSLEDLNKKLSQPQFVESAPVTWQQLLPAAWKELLNRTDPETRALVIEDYIFGDFARQQYNALLQLNYCIRQFPGSRLNERVLVKVQELVSHRFDKVAAQAIAAISILIQHIPDWEGLNQRLMPVSTAPGFRVAKLKLLKELGSRPNIYAAQKQYFNNYVSQDLMPDQRMVAKSIIKYLKLGN